LKPAKNWVDRLSLTRQATLAVLETTLVAAMDHQTLIINLNFEFIFQKKKKKKTKKPKKHLELEVKSRALHQTLVLKLKYIYIIEFYLICLRSIKK
jgi:hypothetical protein